MNLKMFLSHVFLLSMVPQVLFAEGIRTYALSQQRLTVGGISFLIPVGWHDQELQGAKHFHAQLTGRESRGDIPKDGAKLNIFEEENYPGETFEDRVAYDRSIYISSSISSALFQTSAISSLTIGTFQGSRYDVSTQVAEGGMRASFWLRQQRAIIDNGKDVYVFSLQFGEGLNESALVEFFNKVLASVRVPKIKAR